MLISANKSLNLPKYLSRMHKYALMNNYSNSLSLYLMYIKDHKIKRLHKIKR